MITTKEIKFLGILLAIALIVWSIFPFITSKTITSDILSTSIIFLLIGFSYLIIVFKPQWNKAILFVEGIIIGLTGYLLDYPYNIYFAILGIIIVILAILAYKRKLPSFLLNIFYK